MIPTSCPECGAWPLPTDAGFPQMKKSAFIGASNTSALGGDLAFDYATHYGVTQGYGADMTVDAVRKEVQEQSGNNWQAANAAPTGSPDSTLVDLWVALQAGTDLVISSEAGASNPIAPTGDPATDSLMFAALAAGSGTQPSWAVR